ncbi:TetR/AcrR family transcriptional regulator [Agrococcus baldri]|uniref:TetR family transcriptional regulator n=1 Tax=Agrococcus baldri TaxID=153730 RepID=A0AA87UTK9_9MICO|nr:TetR/AcrR family transcriptional regulator [Agrococcus baldri]GEK81630.1 TetR family transcriptional regulator [Agrococcus baldri]
MAASRGPGRPRASSAATIHEAALELFLERGYDAVSVDDIARRAGVSRGTVFSYCDSKADALWVGLDAAIERAGDAIAEGSGDALQRLVDALVHAVGPWGATPPTALRDAQAMGAAEALRDGAPARLQPLLDRAALALALERDALPESADAAVAPVTIIAAACAALVAWARTPARPPAAEAVRATIAPIASASRTRDHPAS